LYWLVLDQELASQEVKDENAYQPSKDQIEAYEDNRQYYNENIKVDARRRIQRKIPSLHIKSCLLLRV
jgi:hypothetical protein